MVQKSWNEDLVKGLRAREQQAFQQQSDSHFMWRDAAIAIEAVRKDIKLTSTGKIFNLPVPGKRTNKLTKTAHDLCQRIIRGEDNVYPNGHTVMTNEQYQQLKNRTPDRYIQSNIKKRGGAHAILMAFHHGRLGATITKDEICRCVKQLNLCDEEMDSNFHAGRMYGAWKSKDTLVKRGYLLEYRAGVSFTDVGFRSNGKNTYSLSDDGRIAIQRLLERWPDTKHCPNAPTHVAADSAGGGLANAAGDPAGLAGFDFNPFPIPIQNISGCAKKTKHSDGDERELREWVKTAPVSSQKSFKMGKDRRRYLHNVCDRIHAENPGLCLRHESKGDGSNRRLYVTIHERNPVPVVTPGTGQKTPPQDEESYTSQPRRLFSSTGNRLGGNSCAGEVGMSSSEAAAKAALDRHSGFTSSKKRSRPTPQRAHPPKRKMPKSTNEEIVLSDDEMDDMDRKPAAKEMPLFTTEDDKDVDYQPGDEVFVTDESNGKERGPLRIVKTHASGHVTVQEDDGRKTKVSVNQIKLDTNGGEHSKDNSTEMMESKLPAKPMNRETDDILEVWSSQPVAHTSCKRIESTSNQITILIDSRERSRNGTPRELRIGLSRQLREGLLKSVWPKKSSLGEVVERTLEYGDFAFEMPSKDSDDKSRLSVTVERKVVRDLVQRSAGGDHWKQLQRMRDSCQHAILLIENDTRLAGGFIAYRTTGDDRKVSDYTIQDESDLFLFIGRAILSSPKIRFIQTQEQQGTFRSVGSLALASMCSSRLDRNAPTAPRAAGWQQQRLNERLTDGGIDWRVADAISKEIGSTAALEHLFGLCETQRVKESVLLPVLQNRFPQNEIGDPSSWSSAVVKSVIATPTKRSQVRDRLFQLKNTYGGSLPADEATIVSNLYTEDSNATVIERSMEYAEKDSVTLKRKVNIEVSDLLLPLFEAPNDDSFYRLESRSFRYEGRMRLTTTHGTLNSDPLHVYLVKSKTILDEITKGFRTQRGATDYIALAREATETIHKSFRRKESKNARHVVLVHGMKPALDALAKSNDYKDETKVLCEMVFAFLMLDYNYVVLQAIRKKEDDLKMILRQLALSCYYYQYLTKEDDDVVSKEDDNVIVIE